MDGPSMLLRFLPVAKDLAQNESDLVDRLSFLKSLFHVHARHSKVPENVSYEVAAFTQSHASAFAALSYKLDKTWVVDPTNSRFRAATAAMPSSGRLCYSKLVNPFVKAGERDAQTVLKVASSVSQMASLDLWPKHILPIAVPVLCRELFHGSKQTAETKHHLSMLIMEASVLECYHLAYLKTPETRRMQATQPVTRKLFWNAAFFYSELHTMWEQHIGTPEFDDIVRQHVQKTHEVRTRIVTGLIQIPENIVARTKIMQQLERRLLSTHTDDHAAREALHQKRTEVAALDVCVLRTEYEDIHSVLDGANRLIAFLEMEGPFIPMTRVTDTPTSTPPSVERQPTTTQQIDDIIDGMSQLFNPTTDTTGFWAAHLDEEEPKKKRRSRRSRRTKAQTATEEDDSPAEEEEIQPARDDDAEELIRQQQSLVAEASRAAREAVLNATKVHTDVARDVVTTIIPGLETLLAPTIECFMCLSPIDFDGDSGVRFLTCCTGGSFACGPCVGGHGAMHTVIAEVHVVRLAATMRRQVLGRNPP